MRKILFLALMFASLTALGQEGKDPLGYEAILESLINGEDAVVIIENKSVDLGNFTARKIDRLFPEAIIDSGKLIINKSLIFRNCELTGRGFRDISLDLLRIQNSTSSSLIFMSVSISNLTIVDSEITHLKVLNSKFEELTLNKMTNTSFEEGEISVFKSRIKSLDISRCIDFGSIGVFAADLGDVDFSHNQSRVSGMASNTIHGNVNLLDEYAGEFRIRKNVMLADDSARHVFDVHCDRLTFIQNTFNSPVLFTESQINTRVEMADNEFRAVVDLHVVALPEFDKYIPYRQFLEGLVVYKNVYGEDSPDGANCYYCEIYTGGNDEELSDKTNFDKLVHSYEILFLGYKATGDIESANEAYIQIKDLYLKRLGYLYRTNGGFKHYFRWKLAQLLKFYTNHGTDPALSIVISIYVVLAFAVFYFFFPSEWDVTSKARLIADFREFIDKNDKGRMKPFLSLAAGFGISIVNAITLSLNSFVTLGFGSIPTTGAARYVCIIQGFIGWFLLSIFTVSLINQILF